MKSLVEGIGVPVAGYEEDYLLLEQGVTVGMARLLKKAGATPVDEIIADALTCTEHRRKDLQEELDEYRHEAKREYPQVYRVSITVELSPLSDEESAAFWKGQLQKSSPERENP